MKKKNNVERLQLRDLAVRSVAGGALIERLAKPVFLVDARRRVALRNAAAERMLGRPDAPLRVRSGRLQAQAEELQEAIAAACVCLARGRSRVLAVDEFIPMAGHWAENYYGLSVGRALGDTAYRAYGIDPQLIVTVHPRSVRHTAPLALWYAVFAFTPAESRLAVELWDGKSMAEASDGLGIAISTARSQLLCLFRKTRTARQSELVRTLSLVAEAGANCAAREGRE